MIIGVYTDTKGIVRSPHFYSSIGELIDALKETLDLPVRSVAELLPEVSLDEEDEWIDSPQAYGVLLA